MKHTRLFILVVSFFGMVKVWSFDVQHNNLYIVKKALIKYIHSGLYDRDIWRMQRHGLSMLRTAYQNNSSSEKPQQLAVVFDIDETLLSNRKSMQHYGFGGDQQVFDHMVSAANASVIQPIAELYVWAKQHHMKVYLITGRPNDLRKATIRNLHKAHLAHWDGLYFWPRHSKLSIQEFKSSKRQDIERGGVKIVLNVGDQMSDLNGGYAQHILKLPNPFYTIPANHHRH